jgi:hypothetical protein
VELERLAQESNARKLIEKAASAASAAAEALRLASEAER